MPHAIATHKKCGTTRRIEIVRTTATRYRGYKHEPSGQLFELQSGDLVPLGSYQDIIFCGCDSTQYNGKVVLRYQIMYGKLNQDKKCDARCTNAKGNCCECQCGGKNHGSGHQI